MIPHISWLLLGAKVKQKHIDRVWMSLPNMFVPNEQPLAMVRGLGVNPPFDMIVITDRVIYTMSGAVIAGTVPWETVVAAEVKNYAVRHTLVLTHPTGGTTTLPLQDSADIGPLRAQLPRLLQLAREARGADDVGARFDEMLDEMRADPSSKLVPECTVLGGHGFDLEPGRIGELRVGAGKVLLHDPSGAELLRIAWDDITSVEFVGEGLLQTGGGFMGGGFGLTGFAVGLAAATALNAVTSRTHMDSGIRIQTRDSELLIHSGAHDPATLRTGLSQLVQHVQRPRDQSAPTPSPPDAIQQLRDVKELHSQGILTDAEYEAARSKLAGRLAG